MSELTILTITRGESHSLPFLQNLSDFAKTIGAEYLIGLDMFTNAEIDLMKIGTCRMVPCTSSGAIEHVLADVSQKAHGDWILRIDDDESMSMAMEYWVKCGSWLTDEYTHYSFPTAWLWNDLDHYLINERMFPDVHTRLVKRDLMRDWPRQLHASFSHGVGKIEPVLLLHHKFLVKNYSERQTVAARYDCVRDGGGSNDVYKRYSLPEDVFSEMRLAEVGTGLLQGWQS